jgi:hypothetical protein
MYVKHKPQGTCETKMDLRAKFSLLGNETLLAAALISYIQSKDIQIAIVQ